MFTENLYSDILSIQSEDGFNEIALQLFRLQAIKTPVYRDFVANLGIDPLSISHYSEIPFLPIELFKNHKVLWEYIPFEKEFRSSGTSGMQRSSHFIADLSFYQKLSIAAFSKFYGDPSDYTFLALLPSYMERDDSSLIYMLSEFMKLSPHKDHGFFLNSETELYSCMDRNSQKGEKMMLWGVTFALLDLAKKGLTMHEDLVVMETGGMKGRGEEMTREEVHNILKRAFQVPVIHSEYGMTELLSQAYATDNGLFQCPPWMKVLIREVNDPFAYCTHGKTGGINIIDLGNVHSCSFIATQDLGRLDKMGFFEVLGRFDQADVRGCNLLVI